MIDAAILALFVLWPNCIRYLKIVPHNAHIGVWYVW